MKGYELERLLRQRKIPRKALAADLGVSHCTVCRIIAADTVPKRYQMAIKYLLTHGPEEALLTHREIMTLWRSTRTALAEGVGVSLKHVCVTLNGHGSLTKTLSLAMRQLFLETKGRVPCGEEA